VSTRDGNQEIYVMNADGSDQTRLTNTPSLAETAPGFSPDGTKIGYIAIVAGQARLFLMNADGSGSQQMGEPFRPFDGLGER